MNSHTIVLRFSGNFHSARTRTHCCIASTVPLIEMDIIDVSDHGNDENIEPVSSNSFNSSIRKCARCKKEHPLDQFVPDTKTRRRQLRTVPISSTNTKSRTECLKCRQSHKGLLKKRHAKVRAAKEASLFVPMYFTWERLLRRIETTYVPFFQAC